MPTYLGFLRAVNVGKRQYRTADLRAALEGAGYGEVDTHIQTGNVRITSPLRSVAKVTAELEALFLADRGFEVPTIVFTTSDLASLTARAEELHAEHDPAGQHYVTLYSVPPTAEAAQAVHALEHEGERVVVDGRAAHVLLDGNIHTSKVLASKPFTALGQGTARTIKVLRTVTEKWC